jgi:hypothetical protein
VRSTLIALTLLLAGGNALADELPDWIKRTTFSGLMFGDAYWVTANHDPAIEGENGFWLRRIYLTLDSELSDRWALRVRLEMNSPGDFTSDDRIEPFVKDVYLKRDVGDNELYLGLSPTPLFELIESSWRYRFVEKTPLDLQRFSSTREFGVAVKGSFGENRPVRYHAMVGNGSGARGETNEGKKAMLAVSFHPAEKYSLQVYGDFENRPGETDRTTYQLFGAYNGEKYRFGAVYASQTRENAPGAELDLDIASLYAVFRLGQDMNLLARVDQMFDPNPEGASIPYIPFDPTAESLLAVLGLDFALGKRINLIPNVEAVHYSGVGGAPAPDDDLIVRFTVFAQF